LEIKFVYQNLIQSQTGLHFIATVDFTEWRISNLADGCRANSAASSR
jgi:hypothetical protein